MGKKKPEKDKKDAHLKELLTQLSMICEKQSGLTVEDEVARLKQDLVDLEKPLKALITHQDKTTESPVSTSRSTEDDLKEFTQWLAKGGCTGIDSTFGFESVRGEGIGLVARKDLADAEMFLAVPRSVMLNQETAGQFGEVAAAVKKDPLCARVPGLAVALLLLAEKRNPQSRFAPYLRVLPSAEELSLPLFFKAEELALLEGSTSLVSSLRMRRQLIRQYVHVMNHPQLSAALAPLSFREFRWAIAIIMSRQNQIPAYSSSKKDSGENGTHILSLIPGWDFGNHRPGKIMSFFNSEDNTLECSTMCAVRSGQPIHLYYGPRPNVEFFVFQGFVFQNNPNDCAIIDTSSLLNPQDPLLRIKQMLLTKFVVTKEQKLPFFGTFPLTPNQEEEDDKAAALVTFARISQLDKEEVTRVLTETGALESPPHWLLRVSDKNEQAVVEKLSAILNAKLNSIAGGDAKQDEVLLAEGKFEGNSRLAVEVRLSEKVLLGKALEHLQGFLAKK